MKQDWCGSRENWHNKKKLNFDSFRCPYGPQNWVCGAHFPHTTKRTCNDHVKRYWCETSENVLRKWPKTTILDLFWGHKWPRNWASEAYISHTSKSTCNEHVKQYWCKTIGIFLECDQRPEFDFHWIIPITTENIICITLGAETIYTLHLTSSMCANSRFGFQDHNYGMRCLIKIRFSTQIYSFKRRLKLYLSENQRNSYWTVLDKPFLYQLTMSTRRMFSIQICNYELVWNSDTSALFGCLFYLPPFATPT